MKVTPQITADFEEYPELRNLLGVVLRPLVDIMGAHAIASVRRIRKTGVFDHPYDKDIVAGMDIPGMPETVRAAQYAVGKALLDYLATVGVSGVTVEASEAELQGIAALWMPQACNVKPGAAKPPAQEPKPAAPETPASPDSAEQTATPEGVPPENVTQPKKEADNGEQANS